MKVQRYERRATPLNERIRYFFEVMFWLIVVFFVFFCTDGGVLEHL